MAKLLYSATMSLDGFIAGPGGDMSWLTPYVGPDPLADGLVDRIGSLLIGNRTFGGDDPDTPVPDVTFVDDLAAGIRAAKEAAGERYASILGADVARQCLQAGELDEILVFIAPVLLGDGTRLFDRPGGARVGLERTRVSQAPLATAVWYRVPRA